MSFWTDEGQGVGGGSGNASVGGLLREAGTEDKGIHISHDKGDLSWHMQVEAAAVGEDAVSAALSYRGAGSGNSLRVTFDTPAAGNAKGFIPLLGSGDVPSVTHLPEDVNTYDIFHFQYDAPDVNSRSAFHDWGSARITSAKTAEAGNTDWLTIGGRSRTPSEARNARAAINGRRLGSSAGHITVVSPSIPKSRVIRIYSASTARIRVTQTVPGNGVDTIAFQYGGDLTAGTPEVTYRNAGGATNTMLVRLKGTTNFDTIIAAINAATDSTQSNKKHLFAEGATTTTGAAYSNVGVNFVNSGSYASGAGHALGALQGGGEGAATNTGWVRVMTGGARTDPVRPFRSINVAGPGDTAETLVIERSDAYGNTNTTGNMTVGFSSSSLADGNARVVGAFNSLNIDIRGTVTLQAIVDAFGTGIAAFGSNQTFTARLVNSNDGANTVTWDSGDADRVYANPSFSGGATGANPLTATLDRINNQLKVTGVDTDTFADVIAEIVKLDAFQEGTGSAPGDVFLTGGGLGTDTLSVRPTEGGNYEYAFTGGTDEVTREALVVTDSPDFHFNPNTLYINKWLRTDTVQDLIDAYSGSQFTITAPSGDTTDTLDGPADLRPGSSTIQLAGGRGPVTRQTPTVSLIEATAHTASYSVFYHGSETTGASRSTLTEMKAAWDSVLGQNRPLSPDTVTITGDGSVVLRNAGIPSAPTGGRNYVAPGLNELLARPEDETDGPNILVKYDVADDLDTVYEHFLENNNGGFRLTRVWGTNGSGNPESPTPSFSRDFYSRPPTTRATGPTDGLTQAEVDVRVRSLTKGYALKSGGQVSESDIPPDIARDSEIPDPFGESLFSDATPSASDDDEVPFFNVAGAARKATTHVWRAKFKGWVGDWGSTPGSFIFRKGDLTEHDGLVYIVIRDSTKNLNAGPNTNADFLPITMWSGSWSTGWYKPGVMVSHGSGIYVSSQQVTSSDGSPHISSKWTRIDSIGTALIGAPTFSNGDLTFNDRDGTAHTVTIPTGGTQVAANPGGSDGDILSRLAIGGVNYIVGSGAEVDVGLGRILGRVTSTTGKHPTDLPDHTDPIEVPPPVSKFEDPDDAGQLARIEASRNWPVVPFVSLPSNGGFLSSLDTAENSVRITEGMYVLGMAVQNIWTGRETKTLESASDTTAGFVTPGGANTRLSVVGIIEYEENGDWLELSRTTSPYIRAAPHVLVAREQAGVLLPSSTPKALQPGSVDGSDNPSYDGALSPAGAAIYSAIVIPPGGLKIRFRLARGADMSDYVVGDADSDQGSDPTTGMPSMDQGRQYTPWGYFADVSNISIFPLGRPTQTQPIVSHPYITSFEETSGNLDPAEGSIAALVYGYSYRIAQSGRVGAARIIGFKGDVKPTGTTVTLATLTDHDHGVGTVTIPAATSLAAGEKYRIRLQVFDAGVTPTADTTPVSYQDIVITAHASTTANYHWGRIAVDGSDADAAATAARVVFADDDITTGRTLAASYAATPPSMGTTRYQFYLAVRDGSTEPTGWNSGGLNADAAFQAPVTRAISSVDWKFWVLSSAIARASADGSINYEPRTS